MKQIGKVYDDLAEQYYRDRKAGENIFNEYIDMPATLSLFGNIKGKNILDIGCGPGFYAKQLVRRGAKVWGVDPSKKLLKFARKEAPKAVFQNGIITRLRFPSGSFDMALSALMLDHVKDLDAALREVRRVLKPGGLFIFSIPNPVFTERELVRISRKKYWLLGYRKDKRRIFGDYFKGGSTYEHWGPHKVIKVSRTYESIIKALVRNKFKIIDYIDAKPIKKAKKLFPKKYRIFSRLPWSCSWKVQK